MQTSSSPCPASTTRTPDCAPGLIKFRARVFLSLCRTALAPVHAGTAPPRPAQTLEPLQYKKETAIHNADLACPPTSIPPPCPPGSRDRKLPESAPASLPETDRQQTLAQSSRRSPRQCRPVCDE